MIPKGWKKKTIDDLCDLLNGNGFKSSEWDTTGLPIIRIQNLNGSRDFNYFSGEPKERWIVQPGDLLFAWAGVKGVSFGPCLWSGPTGVLNQHIYKVIPKNGVTCEFLHALLDVTTQRIEANSHGFKANFVHVQKGDIVDQTVHVPPLSEQQKIAAILSTWDRAIELTEKLIAAKQKRKQALVHALITEPLWAMRHGKHVSGWDETSIGTLVEKRTQKSSDLSLFPLYSFTIEDGVTPKTDRYERSFLLKDSDNNKYSVVQSGDFVINPMNLRFGAIGRSGIDESVSVSAYYDVFYVVDPRCDSGFLEHVLKSPLLMHTYETVATGSLVEKKRVHFSEFVKISVSLPSLEQQARIASIIDQQDLERVWN